MNRTLFIRRHVSQQTDKYISTPDAIVAIRSYSAFLYIILVVVQQTPNKNPLDCSQSPSQIHKNHRQLSLSLSLEDSQAGTFNYAGGERSFRPLHFPTRRNDDVTLRDVSSPLLTSQALASPIRQNSKP